jgi:hypothetical protein
MTTLIAKQQRLIVDLDDAIATSRKMIVERGAQPVVVPVRVTPGDGIEGAIHRRCRVNLALAKQVLTLTKGDY